MQLVHYTLDPSGGGMTSKIGKFTSEKYTVFQHKDEIQRGKPKYLQVSQFPQFDSIVSGDNDERSQENYLNQMASKKKTDSQKELNTKKLETPFDKTISRSQHFLNQQVEKGKIAPPLGMYRPKHHFPQVKVQPEYNKELILKDTADRHQWSVIKSMTDNSKIDIERSTGQLKKVLKVPLINAQPARFDVRDKFGTRFKDTNGYSTSKFFTTDYNSSLNDEYYDTYNTEQYDGADEEPYMDSVVRRTMSNSTQQNHTVCSNLSHSRFKTSRDYASYSCFKDPRKDLDFDQQPKRTSIFDIKKLARQDPIYKPNFKYNKPKSELLNLAFGKVTERKYPHQLTKASENTKRTQSIIVPQKFKEYKHGQSDKIFMSIGKSKPRVSKKDHLPSWMQNSNGSRFALNCMNEKAHVENNFANKAFYSDYNSFKTKRVKNTQKQEFNNYVDEIEDLVGNLKDYVYD